MHSIWLVERKWIFWNAFHQLLYLQIGVVHNKNQNLKKKNKEKQKSILWDFRRLDTFYIVELTGRIIMSH